MTAVGVALADVSAALLLDWAAAVALMGLGLVVGVVLWLLGRADRR